MEDKDTFPEQDPEILKQDEQNKYNALQSSISLNDVMSRQAGRHFVWELLSDCGVYRDGFDINPYIHARNSGVKSIGLKLLQKILIECPDKHEMMFAEHKYKEESDVK